MIGKASVIFLALRVLGKYQQFMAAINSGSFGTAEHAKKAWKLGIIWLSGMKPRNISCYMAYLDGFSPDYCKNSDRFYYVIVSVSSLVLTQQKQKYLKENARGERRKW